MNTYNLETLPHQLSWNLICSAFQFLFQFQHHVLTTNLNQWGSSQYLVNLHNRPCHHYFSQTLHHNHSCCLFAASLMLTDLFELHLEHLDQHWNYAFPLQGLRVHQFHFDFHKHSQVALDQLMEFLRSLQLQPLESFTTLRKVHRSCERGFLVCLGYIQRE